MRGLIMKAVDVSMLDVLNMDMERRSMSMGVWSGLIRSICAMRCCCGLRWWNAPAAHCHKVSALCPLS